jgi:hypothetical protein
MLKRPAEGGQGGKKNQRKPRGRDGLYTIKINVILLNSLPVL